MTGYSRALLVLLLVSSVLSCGGYVVVQFFPYLVSPYFDPQQAYQNLSHYGIHVQLLVTFGVLVLNMSLNGIRWVSLFVVVYITSLLAELCGTTYGIPFGLYEFTDLFGLKLFDKVPVTLPIGWFYLSVASYGLASHAFSNHLDKKRRVLLATLFLVTVDTVADPVLSFVVPYWEWKSPGPYYGVPFSNYLGWFLVGLVIMMIFERREFFSSVLRIERRWWIGFYGIVLSSYFFIALLSGLWIACLVCGVCVGLGWLVARNHSIGFVKN